MGKQQGRCQIFMDLRLPTSRRVNLNTAPKQMDIDCSPWYQVSNFACHKTWRIDSTVELYRLADKCF